MGHSRAEKSASHDRILEIATQQFKLRGLQGIGLAELMKQAGLTHGGFYKHFESRDALVAEAVAHAFDEDEQRFAILASKVSGDPLDGFIDAYLSPRHRDHAATGCSMAALGGEIARAGDATRAAFTAQFLRRRSWVAAQLGGSQSKAALKAATLMGAMVGTLTVARAMGDAALSEEVLANSREQLKTLVKTMRAELDGAAAA